MTDWIGFAEPPSNRQQAIASAGRKLGPEARARLAREWIWKRRHREHFFPSEIFADPAWDMLLDLYAAHYEGETVTISSLCIAGSVPTTTALRWVGVMSDRGWFIRTKDRKDGRRAFVRLSDRAISQLDAYFDTASA
ncbi:MarR family transcriptional regulator [Sphingopyxis panaciterrulae]|uniref:HTH marR-type domain-containing protein n=1 Tax=Sphingopyxis panaciterrulae TaxID=462372 RepID=A0A7W9B7H8_9SPHN|nr:MarR family transcriptional regulator [Sphingopyxis panaciterrulae]MBB5707666.1 hypothetical protein [Sphingopyxis panaciterrulae]